MQDIDEAGRLLAERCHNTFKLKIGRRSERDDEAHVSAIKRALGDQARVTVDINQAWNEADAAGGIAMLEAAAAHAARTLHGKQRRLASMAKPRLCIGLPAFQRPARAGFRFP